MKDLRNLFRISSKTATTNVAIARASTILIVAAASGHALSMVKEILVAYFFGIGQAMDAFYAAQSFPNLISNVLLTTFGAVFIPIFVGFRMENEKQANLAASIILNYLLISLVLCSLILYILAPQLIRYCFHGFTAETMALSIKILRILCFTIIFSGLISALSGILNASRHFTYPAFSQLVITIFTILFMVFFIERWGIYTLAYGLCAGLLAQFLLLFPIAEVKGFKYSFSFDREQPAVKEMISLGFFYLTVIIAAQFNVIVDRIIASYLVPGSIAALGYAGKLIQAPIMIFSSSIATAVFPFFSAQAVKKQIEEMEDSLTKSITMSCFIFIPLTVMLIILARPALQLLFQRGAFDKHATDLTSISFICYSLQLFPVTVWMILSRAYLAFQDIATLLRLAILSLVANLVLNLVFIKIITPPVAGIALATSVVYFVVMLLGFQALKQKMFHLRGKHILKESMKIAIGSCAMGLSVVLVYGFLKDIGIVSYNISQLIRLIAAVLTGIVVFALVSFLSGVREFNKLMRVIFLTNKFMGNL